MLQFIRSRLELKILLLLILVLLTGFGTYVVLTIQRESEALRSLQREKLRIATETLVAGIRNVMLTGKAPFTVEMINDVRQNVRFVDITVYDRFGREVFLREGEGINPDVNDPAVADAIRTHAPQAGMVPSDSGAVFTRTAPMLNRPECWRCHDSKPPLRGAIQLALRPAVVATMSGRNASRQVAGMLANAVASAFRTIMLGGNGEQMDTLMIAVQSIPGVRLVQVYDRMGFLHFGPDVYEIPDSKIREVLEPKNGNPVSQESSGTLRMFVPLVNEDRCQVCHGSKFPKRGVMMVEFDSRTLESFARDPEKLFTGAMQVAVWEGFRSIMLVGRANSARFFMDDVRSMGILQTVRVFDVEGRERFLNPPPRSRPEIKRVVENQDTLEFSEGEGTMERLVRIVNIPNENRCYACHGSAHKVRAAVEVSASMAEINERIQTNTIRSSAVGVLTILLVWLVIRFFMRFVVVRPVQMIESVATRVGLGDLTVQTTFASLDEIGTLARRINEMVIGLRERFQLEKFVSRQTVHAVRTSDLNGVRLGGERKLATVFFSDIRGFTSYSERVEPERVVSMLNAALATQSRIVREFGGDIDKYVGDELVAVFEGDGMVERAVKAALAIQKGLLETLPAEDRGKISIGIGINTGVVVMGAMGSPERMDYTVIGDNVNLGARLCSAAQPGQILLSGTSAEALRTAEWCQLNELEPMSLKGKKDPVRIFEVVTA